ncbi:MAG TPA: diguanylate cyclase [Solirubrobacteraceae bacterium]|nr:diguanylate cyclase [Solirubrobacteraceae bacterium]
MQKLHWVKSAPRPFWLVAIPAALAIVAMALTEIVTDAALWWDVAWTSAAVCALMGTLIGRQATTGPARARWSFWVAACGSWLIGQLAWDLFGMVGSPSSPNLADFGWWMFAILITLSMVRTRTESRALRAVAAAEVLPVIAGATALTFALLWHHTQSSVLPEAQRLSALVYPTLYVSAAVLALQAIVGGAASSVRLLPARLGLSAVMVQALAFILWSAQLLDGTYHSGATVIDPMWVLSLIAIGAAGALSARQLEAEASAQEPGLRGGILPAGLFVVLLGALVRARMEHAPNVVEFTLQAGLLFSGGALVVRSVLLERRLRGLLRRERSALASLADREAELARLNAQLMEDSRRDPLTGMRNRRALADELPRIETGCQEQGTPFGVALCDVDHFKAYNDELGHMAGDQALRAIANTIRGALRSQDMAYRFGGEELLLVLPGAGAEEAAAAAERVRAAVEAAAMPHPTGIGGVVTASIGVASGEGDYGGLLARADAALYEAKRGGRNRVVMGSQAEARHVEETQRHDTRSNTVPRQLRSMLALSRAAASGQGVLPVLQALADMIRTELSFQVVAVNLLDAASAELTAVVVEGDEEARQVLLGTTSPWREWEQLITAGEHIRQGALWLPDGAHEWDDETVLWTPATAAAPDADAWHPHDMLMLPLRGAGGDVLGLVSVDQPLHGRRPDDSELEVLMAVADQAGLAVEQAQRDAVGTGGAREQSQELRLAAVMLLAETLDLRDAGTARHSRTVGAYARHTAAALGLHPDQVERIHAAGVLHDLGKLGIADAILHKPGKLDDAEWKEIQRHPEIGARILEHAGLEDIAAWVRAHHERVDGRGYPKALAGEEIPLEARILAVADAYEAMIADRPYRAGIAPAEASAELIRCAGTQFDPAVVGAFLNSLETSERELTTEPAVAEAA